MTLLPSKDEFAAIQKGYSPNASRSLSLNANAYTDPRWYSVDLQELSPSRRRNSHTALCETFTPRAANSSFSPCNVR